MVSRSCWTWMSYAEVLAMEAVLKQFLYIEVAGLILHTPFRTWMLAVELGDGNTVQFDAMERVLPFWVQV